MCAFSMCDISAWHCMRGCRWSPLHMHNSKP